MYEAVTFAPNLSDTECPILLATSKKRDVLWLWRQQIPVLQLLGKTGLYRSCAAKHDTCDLRAFSVRSYRGPLGFDIPRFYSEFF